MSHMIRFADEAGVDHSLVGGKAASLGRLVAAGFPVPAGFTVSTGAYAEFVTSNDLDSAIAKLVANIDFSDATQVESNAEQIRDLLLGCSMPAALQQEIITAYRELGDSPFVAVRSSGTAEDLAEASFAGMHDTYLDIRGDEGLVDAVKRCWASMWTARATAYRQASGFDHASARVGVVVQTMVVSDVSGVMFTGNPMTARADEIVLNANYGLGESVVSGMITPDELILDSNSLRIKRRSIGSKETAIVRDLSTGFGTVHEEVPPARQRECCLTDEQAAELGDLGRRVTAYYGGLPQDCEWAIADGERYLLQSRPVTGADFTWDEDIDDWHDAPENEETVWTHTWADEFWTGAITPLFYSVRGHEFTNIINRHAKVFGFEGLDKIRHFKYRRGTAFYNPQVDTLWYQHVLPPTVRAAALANVPAGDRDAATALPLQLRSLLRLGVGIGVLSPEKGLFKTFDTVYDYINNRRDEADGPDDATMRRMSDTALHGELKASIQLADDFIGELWAPFFIYAPQSMSALGIMLAKWYDGDNPSVFQDLISGLPKRTAAAQETIDLWNVAQAIRESTALTEIFNAASPTDWESGFEATEEGRALLTQYRTFKDRYGHRGHADRDIYYPRRYEDQSIDYQSIKMLLSADGGSSPEESETRLIQRREETEADVIARIRKKPFGSAKAEAFKSVVSYIHRFLVLRDDEREYIDRVTVRKKRGFTELGRRLVERGLLEEDRDFYFLSEYELYAVLAGNAPGPLTTAKVAARKRVFDAYLERTEVPPTHLKGSTPVDLDQAALGDVPGVMQGLGTSRGTVTGRARVVPSLKDIGKVEKDDILICNSTDPGWAPVFLIVSAVVVETGGMLAHASCLSREYGLPAVQLTGAMRRIEDGAIITVNGDTGVVRLAEEARDTE